MANWEIGFEGKTYPWDDQALMLSEAREIKKWLGVSAPEWLQMLQKDDPEATTALICILRRRDGEPQLRYNDVDGDLKTLTFKNVDLAEIEDEDAAEEAPDPTQDVA